MAKSSRKRPSRPIPRVSPVWPVLRTYDADHLLRVALPLGGIGTGTVSLGGRGDLRDWEIMNRPAKGYTPRMGHGTGPGFVLWAKRQGGSAVTRMLEGPLEPVHYETSHGATVVNHGLPRFRHCGFAAAYPLGQVLLRDRDVPLDVRLEAFNPMVPADTDASGEPIAVFRYVLINRGSKPVEASVCGNVMNIIGKDGSRASPGRRDQSDIAGACRNRNAFRASGKVRGLFMDSSGVDPRDPAWGSMALVAIGQRKLSYRLEWPQLSWGNSTLDFWDDFSDDGELDPVEPTQQDEPMGSLAAKVQIPPRSERSVTFMLCWHFPNRKTWTPAPREQGGGGCCEGGACCDGGDANAGGDDPDHIGNWYTTRYRDAWDVAERVALQLDKLEKRTVAFVRAFCDADLPEVVKEAALFNLSTLRSQTCFRTEDGRFFGFEGCGNHSGCCPGSCTHVWNYEPATAMVYGELARSGREIEFAHATRDNGFMSFRVHLPLHRAREGSIAAADGQMGCLIKLYREWRLSGDEAMLRSLWPNARKALAFCWLDGGWDGDRDGLMEGCQHNTMDVEYYGPNPQMQFWYLGALRAAEEMARHLGERDFADRCRSLFEQGSRRAGEVMFSGEYFEHVIQPAPSVDAVAEGLRSPMGASDPTDPDLQLGAGCLIDQLVGQYLAHLSGLGYLTDRSLVRKTLKAVMKHNFRRDFHGHFNHLRSFVLGDESALLMASYPRGRRPKNPFPYYNEVMTGFEYTAAAHMLLEGQRGAGLKVIAAIRDRYDGAKRSPFNEAECGHHYARAMASWAALLALTGFHYDAVDRRITFAEPEAPVRWFWSAADRWGTVRLKPTKSGVGVTLDVLGGELPLETVAITGRGEATIDRPRTIKAGKRVECRVS